MEFTGILQFADKTLCVLYTHTAYYSVYGVNSNTSLIRTDYVYLKVADLVIYLA